MIPLYTAAAVALAALGVSGSAARSDQYPTLNTTQVCHGITQQSDLEAGLFQTSFDQCMKEEQAVRDTMIKEWAAFSSDDKTHCVAEATMGRFELYGAADLSGNGARCTRITQTT